jgi:hypothetical protein
MVRSAVCVVPALALALLLAGSSARADEHSVIRNNGDHTRYIFEAEPHAILGFGAPFDENGSALGLGFRGTFNIYDGFVKSINDSIGVGVGFDFAPGNNGRVLVPVVLQWNFWLSTHWSVFGEPGFAIASGGLHDFDPFVFYVGGRFNFTERIALTMRIGYPDASVGVSFFL